MTATAGALNFSDLARALAPGWEAFSPLGRHPVLLLDLASAAAASPAQLTLCREALPRLACPVIGVAPEGAAQNLIELVDTIVPAAADAEPLLRNIRHHPLAALTLVQLLRHNARCGIEDGLLAESLAYATLQGGTEFRAWLADRQQPPRVAETPGQASVLTTLTEPDTLRITLNRPRQRNALSMAMRDALVEALQLLEDGTGLRRAVIDGAGDCFCVGGELAEFGLAPDPATAHAVRTTRPLGLLIHRHAARIECRLHRACIGSGIELPAFAGRVVARPDAYFQLPEIGMGLIPGAGGTVSLLRRMGRHRLAWLALSGRRIRAATALTWGLVDAVE